MHYNLHVRTKPKRHIPFKKVIVAVVIAVALVATYFVVTHQSANYQKPPVKSQTPA
jgi:hypothetical protein